MELVIIAIWFMIYGLCVQLSLCIGFAVGLYYSQSYFDKGENTGNRYWKNFSRITQDLVQWFARYYFSYHIEYENDDVKKMIILQSSSSSEEVAIFAGHPHGILAISSFLFLCFIPTSTLIKPCVHRLVFKVPLIREFFLWFGAIDVTKENILNMLKYKGSSVFIAPGGCREMIIRKDNNHINDLSSSEIQTKHKGFLKIAFENNIKVFPVIHYGQDRVIRSYSCRWIDYIRNKCLDMTGYPFPSFFIGPFPSTLTTRVLSPLDPTKYKNEESFIDAYYKKILCYH
jgi:hypothetical protein